MDYEKQRFATAFDFKETLQINFIKRGFLYDKSPHE